jgi:4-hydroxybenzoate polyprenyltransferase
VFIALCAVALAFTNQLTACGTCSITPNTGFVFFSTLFTYSLLKFRKIRIEDTGTTHHNWADEHPQVSRNLLLISFIATAYFFFLLSNTTQLVVLLLTATTAFYALMPLPFTNPPKTLRNYGLLKTFFVALVWSVTTVIIPLQNLEVEKSLMAFLLIRRFLFVLSLAMVFEIKDYTNDREFGIYTLPMRIGISGTKCLAQGILMLLIAINVAQFFFLNISAANMLAINFSLLVTVICIQPLKEDTADFWYYLVLDGMMVLQFVFVFTATFFFE